MSQVRHLITKLTADVGQFDRSMQQSARHVKGFADTSDTHVPRATTAFEKLALRLAGVPGPAAASVRALLSMAGGLGPIAIGAIAVGAAVKGLTMYFEAQAKALLKLDEARERNLAHEKEWMALDKARVAAKGEVATANEVGDFAKAAKARVELQNTYITEIEKEMERVVKEGQEKQKELAAGWVDTALAVLTLSGVTEQGAKRASAAAQTEAIRSDLHKQWNALVMRRQELEVLATTETERQKADIEKKGIDKRGKDAQDAHEKRLRDAQIAEDIATEEQLERIRQEEEAERLSLERIGRQMEGDNLRRLDALGVALDKRGEGKEGKPYDPGEFKVLENSRTSAAALAIGAMNKAALDTAKNTGATVAVLERMERNQGLAA